MRQLDDTNTHAFDKVKKTLATPVSFSSTRTHSRNMEGYGLDLSGSRLRQMVVCFENGNALYVLDLKLSPCFELGIRDACTRVSYT